MTVVETAYRDLYYRWEREQWSVGELALASDRAAWARCDPEITAPVRRALSAIAAFETISGAALVALIDAAPTEEQQVFLSTQLADAARHAVFVETMAKEVIGGALEAVPGPFDDAVRSAIEDLTPDHMPALARAVALVQVVVEGAEVAARIEQSLTALPVTGALAGTRSGLEAVERDRARHVDFGMLFLSDLTRDDSASKLAARRAIQESLERLDGAASTRARELSRRLGLDGPT